MRLRLIVMAETEDLSRKSAKRYRASKGSYTFARLRENGLSWLCVASGPQLLRGFEFSFGFFSAISALEYLGE